jgi:hypothetical protein
METVIGEVRISKTDHVRVDGDGMTLRVVDPRHIRSVACTLSKSGDPDNIDISAAILEALDDYERALGEAF